MHSHIDKNPSFLNTRMKKFSIHGALLRYAQNLWITLLITHHNLPLTPMNTGGSLNCFFFKQLFFSLLFKYLY